MKSAGGADSGAGEAATATPNIVLTTVPLVKTSSSTAPPAPPLPQLSGMLSGMLQLDTGGGESGGDGRRALKPPASVPPLAAASASASARETDGEPAAGPAAETETPGSESSGCGVAEVVGSSPARLA